MPFFSGLWLLFSGLRLRFTTLRLLDLLLERLFDRLAGERERLFFACDRLRLLERLFERLLDERLLDLRDLERVLLRRLLDLLRDLSEERNKKKDRISVEMSRNSIG